MSATTPPNAPVRRGAGPHRREVLTGLGAVAAAAAFGTPLGVGAGRAMAAAPGAELPDDFLLACSRLSGVDLDKSYLEIARALWAAISATPGDWTALISTLADARTEVQALADVAAKGLMTEAKALNLAWYSGMVGSTVITYDEALMWRVCSFTKPPASCGGEFGYWEHAPGETA